MSDSWFIIWGIVYISICQATVSLSQFSSRCAVTVQKLVRRQRSTTGTLSPLCITEINKIKITYFHNINVYYHKEKQFLQHIYELVILSLVYVSHGR